MPVPVGGSARWADFEPRAGRDGQHDRSDVCGCSAGGGDAAWVQRVLIAVVAIGAGWLLGHVEGRRLGAVRALEQVLAEQARAEQLVVVARDVHDVVGHSLGVISAEAGVARILPDTDDEELRAALESIECRARSSLVEVQRLVRSLRSDQAPSQPGLESLSALIAAARSTGLQVETHVDGEDLPPELEATATRLVQEALSNVVRHAHANSCLVSIAAAGGELRISVADDGCGLSPGTTPGLGILGMRERAQAVGGTFSWSTREGGGTTVQARLPLGATT